MSRTRDALTQLGSANSDALVEAGKVTLRNLIAETLRKAGITEAIGFEVKLKNGEEFTILSENSPRMATSASEVESVRPRQSARAGSGEQVRDWSALLV